MEKMEEMCEGGKEREEGTTSNGVAEGDANARDNEAGKMPGLEAKENNNKSEGSMMVWFIFNRGNLAKSHRKRDNVLLFLLLNIVESAWTDTVTVRMRVYMQGIGEWHS